MDINDDMSEFFQCSICMEPFDEIKKVPRLLQCQHSFCNNCIDQLDKNKTSTQYSFHCPTCRQIHVQNILKEIPKNRLIINLINHSNFKNVSKPNTNNVASNAVNDTIISTSVNNFNSSVVASEAAVTTTTANSNAATSASNDTNYLKKLFQSMDADSDGFITANELYRALNYHRNGNNQYDMKLILTLLENYDQNNDKTMSYHEFINLIDYLNSENEKFLLIGPDDDGAIEIDEFINCLKLRSRRKFSDDFIKFVEKSLTNSKKKLIFSYYIQLITKFDRIDKATANFREKEFERTLKLAFFEI